MARRALTYDPTTSKYTYRQAGVDYEVSPGGSGNATSIRGIPVESGTPLDGESITYDVDGEQWVYAAGGGGVPGLTHAQVMSRAILGF